MNPIPLYVLSGGRSSRFGSDKALAELGGRTLISRSVETWAAWASRVTAVADRAGKYDSLGLRTIADSQPGLGPIGGLLTAIDDCRNGWLILVACDAIVLDPELPQRLFAKVSNDVKVVALRDRHWETMPALYHCSILPVVQANIANGQHALWKVIEQVAHQQVKSPPYRAVLSQINSVADLEKVRSIHGS